MKAVRNADRCPECPTNGGLRARILSKMAAERDRSREPHETTATRRALHCYTPTMFGGLHG